MLKPQFPSYFFHAHGVAFGATFTKPFHAVVESQSATAICSIGGHATAASSGPFNFREVVRIGRSSTQIAAVEEHPELPRDDPKKSFDTVVTCSLEDVNIFNQFKADEIVAHLAVKTDSTGRIYQFNTIGTRFVKLRVGGVPVNPTLVDEHGLQYSTGESLHPVFDMKTEKQIPQQMGVTDSHLTTLVSEVKVDSKHIKVLGNGIYVPDFGVVYLAEYLVAPHSRQLNMFRIEFGCSIDGRGSGGGVGANGATCPPPPFP